MPLFAWTKELVTYTTIRGAPQHSATNQQHVDRAVIALNGMHDASSDKIRGHLANPKNVLLLSDAAVALVMRAGEVYQRLWGMRVEEKARGQGIGSALLQHIISAYTADHLMELSCPAARENFYKRHDFHSLYTTQRGNYVYMAGPGESQSDVVDRLAEGHPARLMRSGDV
jgi:GNAT superfamily N-acetyltransferase